MKKPRLRFCIALFLCVMVILLTGAFLLRRPATYIERFPNQVGVPKEVCERLLDDYEDSFDTLISSLASHIAKTDLDYSIDVDKRGHIEMPKELRGDANLVAAIKDIHSDDLFRTNPLEIYAYEESDGSVRVSILLKFVEDECCVSMVYREDGTGPDEYRINDDWFWDVFLMV